MKIVIFEPEGTGHRMVLYVRHIVREVVKRGWQVKLVTTKRAILTPGFQMVADECHTGIETFIIPHIDFPVSNPNTLNLLKYQFSQFFVFANAYRKFVKSYSADFVYVPSLDYCDKIISLLGSPFGNTFFGGLLLSPKFHYKRIGLQLTASKHEKLFEKLFYRLIQIPSMKLLNVIDNTLPDIAINTQKKEGWKVKYVPDPAFIEGTITRQKARESFRLKDRQFVILMYGALSERKGVVQLIEAVNILKKYKDIVVLLAGKQDFKVKKFLSEIHYDKLKQVGRLIELSRNHWGRAKLTS